MKRAERPAAKAGAAKAGAGPRAAGAGAAAKKVGDAKPETYKMKEKLLSFGDDFWIETEGGRKAFKVNGALMAVRDKLSFEDDNGRELAFIRSQFFTVRDRLGIDRVGGRSAQLRKDLVNIVRDQYVLEFDDGEQVEVTGNFLDHEYDFKRGGKRIAEVSKKWFRIADSYGIHIDSNEDHIMFLAACVALDQGSQDAGPIDL